MNPLLQKAGVAVALICRARQGQTVSDVPVHSFLGDVRLVTGGVEGRVLDPPVSSTMPAIYSILVKLEVLIGGLG